MIIKIPRDKVEIFEIVSIKQEFDESCSNDILCDVNDAKATSKSNIDDNLVERETEDLSISHKLSLNKCKGLPLGLNTKSIQEQIFCCNICAAEFQYKNDFLLHATTEHTSNQSEIDNETILGLHKDMLETPATKKEFDERCTYSNILSDVNHANNISKHNLTDDKPYIQGVHGKSEIEDTNSLNNPLQNQIESSSKCHEEEIFQCSMCAGKFQSENNLIQHLAKKHKSKRSYTKYKSSLSSSPKSLKCIECQKIFTHFTKMANHIRKFHSFSCYKCLFCEEYFLSVTNLTNHLKTVHSQSTHACVTCWKVYTSPKCLKTHLKVCQTSSNSNVQTSCELCNKTLCSKTTLEIHLRAHMGIVYPCTECSETFLHSKTMHRHRNLKHRGVSSKCKFCSQIFSYNYELKRHLFTKHKNKSSIDKCNFQLYHCDSCGKKFTRKDHMRDHIRCIHLNEGYCKICSHSFSSLRSLKRHFEMHHEREEKNIENVRLCSIIQQKRYYFCNLCSKKFSEKRSLRDHLNVKHYGVPKVVCEVCGKNFSTLKLLQRHKKQHGNVRRFSCHLCEKSYTVNCELLKHLRSHLHKFEQLGAKPGCSKCKLQFRSNKKFMHHIQVECRGRFVCYYCNMMFDSKQKLESHIHGYHFLQVTVSHLAPFFLKERCVKWDGKPVLSLVKKCGDTS
ncbi:hypothetical protein WDU94_001511 [Cyamophila willieti]